MPSSNRKKGLKVLGLSAMHMVQAFLENDVQGTLGSEEYFLFWRDLGSVGSERDNTEWLRLCVSMLLEVMDGKKQPGKYHKFLDHPIFYVSHVLFRSLSYPRAHQHDQLSVTANAGYRRSHEAARHHAEREHEP